MKDKASLACPARACPPKPKGKIYVQKIRLCVVREDSTDKTLKISCPQSIAKLQLIENELINSDREKFICLHLDTKNAIISYEVVSVGCLNATVVHPREVYKGAILSNASSVIFCHNHPSGIADPSKEDIALTNRLKGAGDLLGVEVLDHLIFGHDVHVSFKEKGLL